MGRAERSPESERTEPLRTKRRPTRRRCHACSWPGEATHHMRARSSRGHLPCQTPADSFQGTKGVGPDPVM